MSVVIALMLVLSCICMVVMVQKLKKQAKVHLSLQDYLKLAGSGVIAFISDTLGIGSFAVNIAMAKLLKTFEDHELPPMVNGAQIIPGALESLFFMKLVSVDMTTLFTLVLGTCIGGLLGGHIVSRMSKQAIRLMMIACFSLIMLLLASKQLHLLPVGGHLESLSSWKLIIGFFSMTICGALTSAGIGLFAMVQGVLFLLGLSPAIAFPIMTTAGAMQQPLTTLVFLKQNKIPLKKTLVVSFGGCLGVLLVLPVFSLITSTWLHNLLIAVLVYNIIMISRAYWFNLNRYKETHLALAD
jgi:uncharacterized membrane protein YfcA